MNPSKKSLFTEKEIDTIKKMILEAKKKTSQSLAVIEKSNVEKIAFEHDTLSNAEQGTTINISLKATIDCKESIIRSNVLDESIVRKAIEAAKQLPKKEITPLPNSAKYRTFLPDNKVICQETNAMVEHAKELIKGIQRKDIIASSGAVIKAAESRIVASTSGVFHEDTNAQYHMWGSAVSKSKKSTYSDSESQMKIFRPGKLARKIAEKTMLFEHSQNLKKIPDYKKLPAIFTPNTAADLLEHAFLSNLNSEDVDKKKSLFIGQLGKSVLGKITLIDDGTKYEGVNSYGCDEEGNPQKKTILIGAGKIKNFITDSYHAKKMNLPSTGNGTLRGPDFSNVILQPFGKLPRKAIVIDGIIGAHTSNSLTTDFSVKVENGFFTSGKKIIPLKPFMISGRMIEFLKNATAVGNDIEERSGIYTGSIASFCNFIP